MTKEGKSKKLLNYITAISMSVAMIVSISSYVKESRDIKARQEAERAKTGFVDHSRAIQDMSKDVQLNRQLLLSLLQNNKTTQPTPRSPIRLSSPRILGGNSTRSIPSPAPPKTITVPKTLKITPYRKQKTWQSLIQQKR